jgi:hypothetical protein
MDFELTKNKKSIICPNCGKESPAKGNVTPVYGDKRPHACLAYGVCPHCKHEACANRLTLNNEPTYAREF